MKSHTTISKILDVALSERYGARASAASSRAYARNIERHVGGVRVSRCDDSLPRRYREAREKEGAAPATVARELRFLRAVLRWAANRRPPLISAAKIPATWELPAEKPRARALSREEAKRLIAELEAVSPWAADVLRLALSTACRIGEILEREHGDVTDDGALVIIRVPDPKEREPKPLVATNGGAEAARRLIAAGAERPFGRPGSNSSADYHALRRAFRSAAQKAGLPDLHLHDGRSTFASWAFDAGVDMLAVSKILGHRSVETTARWYARLSVQTRATVAAAVTGDL